MSSIRGGQEHAEKYIAAKVEEDKARKTAVAEIMWWRVGVIRLSWIALVAAIAIGWYWASHQPGRWHFGGPNSEWLIDSATGDVWEYSDPKFIPLTRDD